MAIILVALLSHDGGCGHPHPPKPVTIADCVEIADELELKESAFRPELVYTGRALADCVRTVAGRQRKE